MFYYIMKAGERDTHVESSRYRILARLLSVEDCVKGCQHTHTPGKLGQDFTPLTEWVTSLLPRLCRWGEVAVVAAGGHDPCQPCQNRLDQFLLHTDNVDREIRRVGAAGNTAYLQLTRVGS